MTFPILASLLVRLVVLLPFQLLRLSLATPSRWTPLALSVFLHCVVALLLRSEERFSRNAETDLVCRLLLEKKKNGCLLLISDLSPRYFVALLLSLLFFFLCYLAPRVLLSFPTRRSSDLSHLGFLAGQIGRLITISTTPVIAGDSFEMDAVGALRLSPLRRGLAI